MYLQPYYWGTLLITIGKINHFQQMSPFFTHFTFFKSSEKEHRRGTLVEYGLMG